MTEIKHIFFDLDHTLWDFDKNSELSFKQIFDEQTLDLDFNTFLETYIPINTRYWELYTANKVDKETLRYRRLKDTFDKLNYNVSDNIIDQISDDYINYLPCHNHLLDGAIELLDYLQEKYKLHIITNGFENVQHQKLGKSNISHYFDVIITSESINVKKPDPRIFEYAMKQVDTKPEHCVMVGDNYDADVIGAFNVGMLPIYIKQGKGKANNGVVSVTKLLEIKQYL